MRPGRLQAFAEQRALVDLDLRAIVVIERRGPPAKLHPFRGPSQADLPAPIRTVPIGRSMIGVALALGAVANLLGLCDGKARDERAAEPRDSGIEHSKSEHCDPQAETVGSVVPTPSVSGPAS